MQWNKFYLILSICCFRIKTSRGFELTSLGRLTKILSTMPSWTLPFESCSTDTFHSKKENLSGKMGLNKDPPWNRFATTVGIRLQMCMVKTCLTPEWFVNWMLLCSIDAIVPWLLFRQVSTHTGCYQQVAINCQYSVAQMCTREDTLAHYLGALFIDDWECLQNEHAIHP